MRMQKYLRVCLSTKTFPELFRRKLPINVSVYRHLTFLKIIIQIPPYPGQNAVQMPHTMVHSGDQMPPPRGRFTGTKLTEGRRKSLQLSNKIFINITKLRNTVSVFTKNKSLVQSGGNRCYKVTECSKRSIKKDPIY